ncbi:response regulator transcription factor [Microbacterium oryzae]|uniref:response regulator n=1 Tax=Microbacterium oryzae TaxID=743009 RepID=UPI0025AF00C7|nr:response regulator transcription factor [Microbacterium oryzae]MDN3311139.1 response regulator transcription factor [Microbacterium oryzae]
MTRVFLVDDHEIVRNGVAALVDAQPDLEVVGEAGTVQQALARVPATSPDVVVLDLRLPDGDGIELCRAIRSAQPQIRCLMLTGHDDDAATVAAVLAGASGYELKSIRGHNLTGAIRRVASGESLVPRRVAERVVAAMASAPVQEDAPGAVPVADLTLRERQVLRAIGEGLTNRQIGERLGLAEKTVKNYVSGLLAKLGMERRTQAAVYATSAGAAGRGGL